LKNKMKFKIKNLYLVLGLMVVGMIAYLVVAKDVAKAKDKKIP